MATSTLARHDLPARSGRELDLEAEVRQLKDKVLHLERRLNAAYGQTQRFDAFSCPGRVAALLCDLRLSLGSSKDDKAAGHG
jgi:hypothetical protein